MAVAVGVQFISNLNSNLLLEIEREEGCCGLQRILHLLGRILVISGVGVESDRAPGAAGPCASSPSLHSNKSLCSALIDPKGGHA